MSRRDITIILTSWRYIRRCICTGQTYSSLVVPKFSVQSSGQWRGIRMSKGLEQWQSRWKEGRIGFHRTAVNPYIKKYIDVLTRGRPKVKVLVPLCGKSVVMKWLAEQGHTVVGVECCTEGAEAFFQESNLTPNISDIPNIKDGKLYQSQDGNISLYVCDFFDFSRDVEADFDAVWDRGALVAINSTDRQRYADLVLSLMKQSACYLLQTVEFDQIKRTPPPYSVTIPEVQDIYGAKFNVRLLETADGMTDLDNHWGLTSLDDHLFLLTPKLPEGKTVNKYGEVENLMVTPEEWQTRWCKGHTGFHKSAINSALQKYVGELTGGRSEVKVLVPLCGKTLDMKWLVDQGHTVIGVEFAEQPVKELFQENSITPTVSDVPGLTNGKLYQSEKLSVYCCDFFEFTSEVTGQFDAVWDRASLIAINPPDRERYATLITSLLKPDGHCLLETVEYDQTKANGPPYSVPGEVIEQLYGAKYNIQHLETGDGMTPSARKMGLSWMTQNEHLLSLKPDQHNTGS